MPKKTQKVKPKVTKKKFLQRLKACSRKPKQGAKSARKLKPAKDSGHIARGVFGISKSAKKQGSVAGQKQASVARKNRGKKRPLRQYQLQAAGLPAPAPKLSKAEFKALQSLWYDKAAAIKCEAYPEGFDDIERSTRPDGSKALNEQYMRNGADKGRSWNPEKAQFYRLLQNYVTHVRLKGWDRHLLDLLNAGKTYREIHAELLKPRRGGNQFDKSLWWVFYRISSHLIPIVMRWNVTSPHGHLNAANADSWATDALLSDLSGTAGVIEAPNGLKLDAGWWTENASDWWRENGGH